MRKGVVVSFLFYQHCTLRMLWFVKLPGMLHTASCRAKFHSINIVSWAAWYNTWLLNKLTPKGIVFSFLFNQQCSLRYTLHCVFFSSLFFSFQSTVYLEVHALLALEDANELTGDDAALVDELVEGVLPIGAWLSKVHLTRLKWQPAAINRHPLTVALHRHLESAALVRQ